MGLLRKIMGVDSGPPRFDKVWQLLSASAPFKTTQEIICCLKNSNLRTKYYNSLHIFSKAFLSDYKAPKNTNQLTIQNLLKHMFEEVLFRWNRYQSDLSFFSYAWLLEKLLKHIGLYVTYKPFLKVLIGPNRRKGYDIRWKQITTLPLKDWLPFQNDRPPIPLGTA
jgi:hypothetical protein